jgi:deoxycytidylate deaminase
VSGAVLVAGGVMFAVGAGDVSSAEKTCPTHQSCTSSSAASTGNTGRTLEGVGVTAAIVGALGVAGGLVWHFTEHGASGTVAVTPVVTPGYAGVGLGASF